MDINKHSLNNMTWAFLYKCVQMHQYDRSADLYKQNDRTADSYKQTHCKWILDGSFIVKEQLQIFHHRELYFVFNFSLFHIDVW